LDTHGKFKLKITNELIDQGEVERVVA
jgi:hypothetical protein